NRSGTAVVIGAGMSGLLAARVLAETFARVLVLERDTLPHGPEFRPGVPQSRHVHVVLARGTQIYEELFPGLHAELGDAGASFIDCGYAQVLFPRGWAIPTQSGMPLLLASRLLLETHVRRRVAALDGVEIRDATQVSALCFDASGTTVVGVRATCRGSSLHQELTSTIEATLVVDASGRCSKLADWLHTSGRSRPQETVVDARLGYASRLYELPEHRRTDPAVFAELLHAPDLPRGYSAIRIEGGRLLVTLQGAAGHHPPHDQEGFTAFVRSLRSPLHQMLQDLRPTSPIYRFARTSSRKVAYHRISDWPGGLIALGDAVCSFNPVYGQGMTVAGIEALLLRDLLARGRDVTAVGCRRFQRQLARAIAWPWLLATFADRGWQEGHHPDPVMRCAEWYMDQWLGAIPGNSAMFVRFLRIAHLLAGPGALLHPVVLTRIFTGAVGASGDLSVTQTKQT
ncbi:MAG: NAD(P)/FAD-dependent oxidoreductase, partial [Pseudonocardiaceae bacterium]